MGRGIATVVAAAALSVSGCGGATGDPPASRSADASPTVGSSPAVGSPTGGPAAAPATLEFTARTVDGKEFAAATLAGKPVVFWFWAAWCPRCRAAADDVAAVQRDFAGRVHVVGVAGLNSGDDAMRKFVAAQGIGGFANLADDAGDVWRRFGVTTQEFYVLLDAKGTVVHKGPLSPDALRERVAALAD